MENKDIHTDIYKARGHDMTDAKLNAQDVAEAGKVIKEEAVDAYKKIENAVTSAYQKIEDGVVGAYKKVEKAAVDAYHGAEDFFVEKLLAKDGETTQEAKERLSGKKGEK